MSRAALYVGDVRTVLAGLQAESVQCVVTSPPYWGLRDYGTASWDGGDAGCDHSPKAMPRATRPASGLTGGKDTVDAGTIIRGDCHCGARRVDNQLGLERTPEEYVQNMVAVFREVRRVLRPDGVLWLNLGDSYSGGGGFSPDAPSNRAGSKQTTQGSRTYKGRDPAAGCKPKDLVGIPWLVAFALRADGWYLRSEIIWAKPNPMPESVTDRPTKAHEQLFLLTKSERYYYDAAAIAEPSTIGEGAVRRIGPDVVGRTDRNDAQRHTVNDGTRNARSVWTIATQPYAGAHFATFPEELARRCIVAGSRPGDVCLDPFGGSGTTASVAVGHGRRAIYIDLNPAYLDLAEHRIGPMLCDRIDRKDAA